MRARRVARGRIPSAVRTGVGGAHVYMATWRSRAPLRLHNLMAMAMRSIPNLNADFFKKKHPIAGF